MSQLMELFWKRVEQRFPNMKTAFRFFDSSAETKVSLHEFQQGCARIGLRLSSEEVKMLFEKFDTESEGQFDYEKFVQLNGDKRGGLLDTFLPGRRAAKDKKPGQGVIATIREEADDNG